MTIISLTTNQEKNQTQAALKAMHAYFSATAQSRPHRERQQLAHEWLESVRRLRKPS